MNYYYQTKTNVNYNNNSTTASDYVTGNGIDEYYPTTSYTTVNNGYVPELIEIKPKKVKYSMDKKIGNRSSMKTNKKQFTRMAVRRG